jgi:uncharacterized protein
MVQKNYFWDHGIRHAIIDNFRPIDQRDDAVALWENFIITERIKSNHYKEKTIDSKFWRSLQQQEVDYVEIENQEISAFEIKWKTNKKNRVTKAFTNIYKDSKTAVITPENFVNFIY